MSLQQIGFERTMKTLDKSVLPNLLLHKIRIKKRNMHLKKIAEYRGINFSATASYIDLTKGKNVIRLSSQHWFYGYDIINSFDYYFDAVRPLKVDDTELVDYSTPRYHDVNGFGLMPIFFPSFSEPITTTQQYLAFANLKPGFIVMDLGAYSGLTSIVFKELVGNTGKVLAIDADKKNLDAIKRNLSLYKRLTGNDIEIVFGAIWNHCNGLSFSSEGNMGSSATEIVGKSRGENDLIESYSLSKLASLFELKRVDFIKCDVEGAEGVIFEDTNFLDKYNPRIIIETHLVEGKETTDKCVADLSRYGYDCKRIEQFGVSLPLLECYPPKTV
jgi:FkbM family methyltransferase